MGEPMNHLLANSRACRVFSPDVSVHWWRNDDSGLCICGSTTKTSQPCRHDWLERGTPGGEWLECFLCGRIEDTA